MQCVQCKGCTEKGHARKDCPREASFCHPPSAEGFYINKV